jgi:hydroxyacylglutathione hydrolase
MDSIGFLIIVDYIMFLIKLGVLKLKRLEMGELQTNCYLIWEELSKNCLIVDPGDDGAELAETIQTLGLKPIGVAVTHGHFDHILGVIDLLLIYCIPFYMSSCDQFLIDRAEETAAHFLKRKINNPKIKQIDVDLNKTIDIKIGKEKLQVIKTPGHTPGGICFFYKKDNWLISGDTIFKELRGRTDFAYGSKRDIFKSICKLMKLPKITKVYSGHGEETTIGKEQPKYNCQYCDYPLKDKSAF